MKRLLNTLLATGFVAISTLASATHSPNSCENEMDESNLYISETSMELLEVEDQGIIIETVGDEQIEKQSYKIVAEIKVGNNECLAAGNTARLVFEKNENNDVVISGQVLSTHNGNKICPRIYLPQFEKVELTIAKDSTVNRVILQDVLTGISDEGEEVIEDRNIESLTDEDLSY